MDDAPARTVTRPNALALLGAILLAAALVSLLPGPLGAVVSAAGTAAHEAGHALAADLLTGDVASITVFRDGGGVTLTEASTSSWRSFVVAAAGYPAPLVAALAVLSAVLFARSSRPAALLGALASLVALVLWAPLTARARGIEDADQRFTVLVLLASALLLGAAAALPHRFDTARRVVLGAFAVGLLADAFRAGRDLVVIEGRAGRVATDADGLAEAAGVLPASAWAWFLRLALFAIAAAWAVAVARRLRPPERASG